MEEGPGLLDARTAQDLDLDDPRLGLGRAGGGVFGPGSEREVEEIK